MQAGRATLAAGNSAFGEQLRDEDFELFRREIPAGRVVAGYDDGRPVGLAASIAFELTIPGGAVPTAGITWVGVLPTHRRRGLLSGCMCRQLEDLHERGEPLAALWASEPVIYGRFGYGLATVQASLDALRAGFAFRDDPGPVGSVRLVEVDEARQAFPRVYERIRVAQVGMLSRSEARWNTRLSDPEHWRDGAGPKFFALLEIDGEPEGYAMYRIASKWEQGVPQGVVRTLEALATSPVATRELWRFLFGIDLVARVKTWRFDPASPLFLMLADARRLNLTISDGLWLRLVDVGDALRRRSYAGEGSVVLSVADAFCPWNEGRYRAGGDAGPTDDPADLRLAVADLASAYLGAFDFEQLAAAERVQELVPGALARASALFRTSSPPFCPEEF